MRLHLRILIVLVCLLMGCSDAPESPTKAKSDVEAKRWIVATDTTLIPMSYIDEASQPAGFEIDLIRQIAQSAGAEMDIVSVEWPGLFGGLITGKYDLVISSVTILEERKARMAFSIPYLTSGLALVTRRDREDLNSLDDARRGGMLVGAQTGTTASFFLEKEPNIRSKGYQAYGHAVTDLMNGELDAVLGESSATLYLKNQSKEYFEKIKMVGEILTKEHYGIVAKKQIRPC